jgi:TPR repeat protein
VPQNYSAALESFEAAALAGNSDAMYNAGLMHKEGRGTLINNSAAEKHFLSASQVRPLPSSLRCSC